MINDKNAQNAVAKMRGFWYLAGINGAGGG
jgi:hypothetical protein